ncbi:carbohydrate-binding protein [Puniceicoccaceae bacterium K14]|nr:carbohydrate-binding protein [Puniceicoccaceae bacterium K14]
MLVITTAGKGTLAKLVLAISLMIAVPASITAQVTVNSLAELIPYLDDDNANVKMAAGEYAIDNSVISDLGLSNPILQFSGNDSTFDFTDVKFNYDTEVFRNFGGVSVVELNITGNNNVLLNLTVEDIGTTHPTHKAQSIVIDGANNKIEGFHVTTRGSYPYGYGDAFGKGGPWTIKHYKHSGILIRGESNHLKDSTVIGRSYGHMVFMQAASNPTIEGCYIEGEVRTTDDMLAETEGPAFDIDFLTVWGYRLPPGYMMSLQEAGIRAYNAGETVIDGVDYSRGTSNPTLLDNTIKNARSGVALAHASGTKYVENCVTLGCERGFGIGSGQLVNCSGDVLYGPLFGVDYENDRGIVADFTILPSNDGLYNGSGHVAFIIGRNHDITFRSDDTNPDQSLAINVGGDNHTVGSFGLYQPQAAYEMTIKNYTQYPLVLDPESTQITYESDGPVTDNSSIIEESLPCENLSAFFAIEAESECENSGPTVPLVGLGDFVSDIENGDWIKYESVNFGRGAAAIEAYVASGGVGGDIEVRLDAVDGTLAGTVTVEPTGDIDTDGWEIWTSVTADLNDITEGTHDVYLVFTGDEGLLFNLDWFKFTRIEASSENYAIGGTATQSTTAYDGPASFAIDGNTSGNYSNGSVTHTENEASPWWEVDLGDTKDIGEIVLYPRTDSCCTQRFALFTVSVLDQNRNVVFSESFDHGPGGLTGPLPIVTNRAIGSIVRVELDEAERISLAEVEVYPYQYFDTDGDGTMDHEDSDIDGDGVDNELDAFPFDPASSGGIDSDGDGIDDADEVEPTPINISTRGYVLDGDKVMIAGFVVEGTDSMDVLIQGVGPELDPDSSLSEPIIEDPKITVYDADGNVVVENDNWESESATVISDASALVGAYTLDSGSMSAAIVTTLMPGAYTVILNSVAQAGGVALVEVYSLPID